MSIHAMPLPHIWEILHQHIDKALAIGECGLDTRIDIPRNQQIEIFRAQAELSMEGNKPLIIHCVRAYDDIIALHKLLKPQNPWIIHGFNRNERIASMLLEQGILLSIGKELLNTRHPLSTFFTKITHYPFFLESDGKDIAIETLYQKAAQLLDRSIEEISSIIEKHVQQVYGRYTSNSTPLE
jgi:TatD DNase family protein